MTRNSRRRPPIPIFQVPHAREIAKRVTRHELGHWLAARALGFPTGDCTVEVTIDGSSIRHAGSSEIILFQPLASIGELEDYIRRRIQVLFAGVLAESLRDDGTVDRVYAAAELESGGAANDFKAVSELRCVLRNILHPADTTYENALVQAKQLQSELWELAVKFVEENHGIIRVSASSLERRIILLNQKFSLSAQEIDETQEMKEFAKKYPGTKFKKV